MKRIFLTVLVLALGAAGMPGCASKKEATAPVEQPQPAQAPPPKLPAKKFNPLFFLGIFGKVGKLFPRKAKPPSARPPTWIGTIKLVKEEEKFVLIDASSYGVQTGDVLITVSRGQETSTLRMSADKSVPFLIADIVNGKPGVGDKVYSPKP